MNGRCMGPSRVHTTYQVNGWGWLGWWDVVVGGVTAVDCVSMIECVSKMEANGSCREPAAAEGVAAVQQQQQQRRLMLLDVRGMVNASTGPSCAAESVHIVTKRSVLLPLCPPALCACAADELASALELPAGAFRRQYHFQPPNRDQDVLVLHSRAMSRAQWAAQMCLDAGCN